MQNLLNVSAPQFYRNDRGTLYRCLLITDEAVCIIDYENPGPPIMLPTEFFLVLTREEVPEGFFPATKPNAKLLAAMDRKYAVIKTLINDPRNIYDKKYRDEKSHDVEDSFGKEYYPTKRGISRRTILEWYFKYLAKGEMGLCPKVRKCKKKELTDDQKNFRWAINKFFYSSRQISLKGTYDLMLLAKYTDAEGKLFERHPSYYQFKYYHYNHVDPVRKIIGQKGIFEYKQNIRPLYGNTTNRVKSIGSYEIDSTIADIYLVARHDRKKIIGRPVIYIAVDIVSRLIAGVYVGLKGGRDAVASCLRQAAMDKVEYCSGYGIGIKPEDWPSTGLPTELITDRAREFQGELIDELCMRNGVISIALPPFRPDMKGVVENTFRSLQRQYKLALNQMGVVKKDCKEWNDVDYRKSAILNLEEFTKVIIHCVLYCNNSRVLKSYPCSLEMSADGVAPVPSRLWKWHMDNKKSNIIKVNDIGACFALLPREKGYFTRNGLKFRSLTYCNQRYNKRCAMAGITGYEEVSIAYIPERTDYIYLVENGKYIRFDLTKSKEQFMGVTYEEVMLFLETERERKKSMVASDAQGRIDCTSQILEIAQKALSERDDYFAHTRESIKAIKQNRKDEMDE